MAVRLSERQTAALLFFDDRYQKSDLKRDVERGQLPKHSTER